tara:strand:- start:26 stop:397 length:372 start_codon:yes stop_codon:yes gene_type:complete
VKRYRFRAVLMLFLVLNVTACQAWQSVSLDAISPAQLIEEDRPNRVRVTGGEVLEREVVAPSVEGDQLVGAGGFSMPLSDILGLEVRGVSMGRTLLMGLGGIVAVPVLVVVAILVDCSTGGCL